MDGRQHGELKSAILGKLTADWAYDKPKGITASFIPVCEFVENGEIIANLAYELSARGAAVCAVDFKVFYPNLFDWLGGAAPGKKGEGLLRLINSERAEVRAIAKGTDDKNVFFIAPSPADDIEDYLNVSIEEVGRVVSRLKEAFDVTLIDVPNNPVLEFCIGALAHCQKGFFTASERVDAPRNMHKLLAFASKIASNAESFNNVILMHQQGLVYDEKAFVEPIQAYSAIIRPKVAARLPFNKDAQQCALDGKVFVRDASFVNKRLVQEGKAYADEIARMADLIMTA